MITEKKKITQKQFAEFMYYCLMMRANQEELLKTAEELGIKPRGNEFDRFSQEWFILSMWLIVHTCEEVYPKEEEKRDRYLASFHKLVFERIGIKVEPDMRDWMAKLKLRYLDFNRGFDEKPPALVKDHFWGVTKVFVKNMWGETDQNFEHYFRVQTHCSLFFAHFAPLFAKYELE